MLSQDYGFATSEPKVSKRDHCEGQDSSSQNGKYEPVPKRSTRCDQPQHVRWKVSLVEVVHVVSVSHPKRHGKTLASFQTVLGYSIGYVLRK